MTMWCHWTGPLKDTEEHLESCNFAFEYTCEYRYLGCNYKGGATDVAAHIRNCALQPSQLSHSTNPSPSNIPIQTPNAPSIHHFQPSSLGTRQCGPSTGQAGRQRQDPISPPQSSPPLPMVPPPPPPHRGPMAQRTEAHPGHGHGHGHLHLQQAAAQQRFSGTHNPQPLYFNTPVLPTSTPPVPQPSPPTQTVLERVGSYDVSQDFEQLSIDDLQKVLDAELDKGDDLALYSPSVVAAATAAQMDGVYGEVEEEEEFVQVERTGSMDELDISDMAMSPATPRRLSPMQELEVITQQSAREVTQHPTQTPTKDVLGQQAIARVSQSVVYTESTQESVPTISPIITQQIQEEALLLLCGQQMEQEARETTSEIRQNEQELERQKMEQEEIPVSDLSTLSPQIRHRLPSSPSPSRGRPAPENDLPPAQRRRIIVDEEESDRGSGDIVVEGDYAEGQQLFGEEKEESVTFSSATATAAAVASATARNDHIPRRSIYYSRQGPQDKNSRVLRDITEVYVRPRTHSPRSTNAPWSMTGRLSTSSSSRPELGSSMGLTEEVFRVLTQHVQHNQPWSSARRRLSEPGQHSPSRTSATSTSARRNSGRFNPLPMRAVPAPPPAQTAATYPSSPSMRSSATAIAASPAAISHSATPLASPPASSSDDETESELAQQQQHQRQQQQPLNPELANFLLLTQNPPHHLVAEAEPQSFVPFVAYKPRYLKSRKKKGGRAGRTYGQPLVRDKGAHDRYQTLMPPVLTPDIISPEDSLASQARLHN
ncbi:hypothetical protein BGX24_009259 [Mortierella sp. AD032]|nr:hypothetical protein BGX24_009259 [Mortierella sp. AD032]